MYFRRLTAVVKSVQEAAIGVQLEPDRMRTHCFRVLERPREFERYTIGNGKTPRMTRRCLPAKAGRGV